MDEMERGFRQADFSRGRVKLEERIWQRIAAAIEEPSAEERELTDDELMHVAAAGSPHMRKPEEKK